MCNKPRAIAHRKLKGYHATKNHKNLLLGVCGLFLFFNSMVYLALGIFSGNSYCYWGFFGFVIFLHYFGFFRLLWQFPPGDNEFEPLEYFSCGFLMSSCSTGTPFINFIALKFLIFFFLLIFWLRPLLVYISLTEPPAGRSSCTSCAGEDVNGELCTGVYNPAGYFSTEADYYRQTASLVFCSLYQRWAYPALDASIVGYASSPLDPAVGSAACPYPLATAAPTEHVNGWVDSDICEGSYPSPVWGIDLPISENTRNAEYLLCPGNQAVPVCISSTGHPILGLLEACPSANTREGLPKVICSSCIGYLRDILDQHPPEYSHCTEPPQYTNPFCGLCPWPAGGFCGPEDISPQALMLNLIFSSVLLGLVPLEYLALVISLYVLRHSTSTKGKSPKGTEEYSSQGEQEDDDPRRSR